VNIQRQYSLPNCQLVVEGLSQGGVDTSRPPIGVVTHVECRVVGHDRPLMGGREFLESLVTAVSEYAQEFLSGIPHPAAHLHQRNAADLVQLQKIDSNLHRLTVQPQVVNPQGKDKARIYQQPETPAAQLDLTTVQLFDLVEAVDQFYADAQTVPELALNLSPLSKRFASSQEPMAKRAVPAALGLAGLSAAAISLFFVPNPPNRRPDPTASTPAVSQPVASATPSASPSPSPEASPSPEVSPSPEASPEVSPAAIASPSPSPEASPSPDASTPPSPTASPSAIAPNSQELEAILRTAPEITDPQKIDRMIPALQDKLYEGWNRKPPQTFTTDLNYQVGVAENGDILGFRFLNDAALTYVKETPLLDLRYNPTGATATKEPIGEFLVVFKPNNVIEISPWYGVVPSP
jgi:Domain of unknown function (DUF4335)